MTALLGTNRNTTDIAIEFASRHKAKARAILVDADQVTDALNLDDTLLDSLLIKLRLE